jgi:protein-S-isoprenylcysteine O-methyltransferase Ste14
MNTEVAFKIAFGLAFVIAVSVAGSTAKNAARMHGGSINQLSNEVKGMIVVRAALGFVFYAMLTIWMVRAKSPGWASLPFSDATRAVAAFLLIPILAFYIWSFRSLGTNYRGGVGLYERHTLVTTGAYRWVRHPIYVSFIAIMAAVLVLSANWVLGLSGLLLVVSIAAARIPVEERELEDRFKSDWTSYKSATVGLVPVSRNR